MYQTLTNYVLTTTATSALPAAEYLMPFEWETHTEWRKQKKHAQDIAPCPPNGAPDARMVIWCVEVDVF